MSNCYEYHRYKPKRYKRVKNLAIFVAVLLCIILLLRAVFADFSSTLISYSQARIKTLSTYAVNDALAKVMVDNEELSELTQISRNIDGKIVSVSANALKANLLSRKLITAIKDNLNEFSNQGISIPIGTLTDLPILSGVGPLLHITVLPCDSVEIEFTSEFNGAGINQTLHRLLMKVTTSMTVIMPSERATITNVVQILLLESLIIGEVPDTYMNITK